MSVISPEPESVEIVNILSSEQLELNTVTKMLEAQRWENESLKVELNSLAQKLLKSESDSKYWQGKCIKLQTDLFVAQFDLNEYKEAKESTDLKQLKTVKEQLGQLQGQIAHLKEAHKSEIAQLNEAHHLALTGKEEVNQRIRQVVDRLNDKLDEQKREDTILNNILSLEDNAMLRFVYTAQFKANEKILHNMNRRKTSDDKTSDRDSSTSSNEDASKMQIPFTNNQVFMGINPMMRPNMQFGQMPFFPQTPFGNMMPMGAPIADFPRTEVASPTETKVSESEVNRDTTTPTEKKIEMED